MKDLVTVLFVLLLGGGGAAGFFYWKNQKAQAEELAYEQAIDATMDSAIDSFQLTPLLTTVQEHHGDDVELIRTLYTNPIKSDRLNLTYGNLQGDWPTSYGHVAETNARTVDRGRFKAEIDERFGARAYDVMQANYEQFLAVNGTLTIDPSRQDAMWIFQSYLRTHGRYPLGPIAIENRQIVEVPELDPAQ